MRSVQRKPNLDGSTRDISDALRGTDLRTRKALTPLRVFGNATNTPPYEGQATPASKRLGRSRLESPSVSVGARATPPVSTASIGKLLTPEMRKLMQTTVRGAQSAENRQVVVEALRSAKKRASPATRKMCSSLIRALSSTQTAINVPARASSVSLSGHMLAIEDRLQRAQKGGRRPPPPPPPPGSPPPAPSHADIQMESKQNEKILPETVTDEQTYNTENKEAEEGGAEPGARENAENAVQHETVLRTSAETAGERQDESNYGAYSFHSAIRNAAAGAVAALGFGSDPKVSECAHSCTEYPQKSQEASAAPNSAEIDHPRLEQQEGMKRFRGWLQRELQGQEQELKELLESDTGVTSRLGTDRKGAFPESIEAASDGKMREKTKDIRTAQPDPITNERAMSMTEQSGSDSEPSSTKRSVKVPVSPRAISDSNSCSAPAQLRAELGLCRAELHQARAQVEVLHGAVRRRDEQLAASQSEVKRQREATRRRELAGAQATREASSLADEALASAKQAKNWMQTAEEEAHARANIERQHKSACAELERERERASTLEKAQAKLKHDHREELQRAVAEKEAEGQAALEGAVNALENAVQLYEEEHRIATEKAVNEAVAEADKHHNRNMAQELAKLQTAHETQLQQAQNAAEEAVTTLSNDYEQKQEQLCDSHNDQLEKVRETQNMQNMQHEDQTTALLEKLQVMQCKHANEIHDMQAQYRHEVQQIRTKLECKVHEQESVANAAQSQAREVEMQLAANVSEHRETMRQLGKASADDARRYAAVESHASQLEKELDKLQQQLQDAKHDAKAAAENAKHEIRCAAEEASKDAEEKAAVLAAVAADRASDAIAAAEAKTEAARAASADAELERRRVEAELEQLRNTSAAETAKAATLRAQLEDSNAMLKKRAEEARAGMAEAIALGERGECDRLQMQQRIDKELQEKYALEKQLQSLQIAAKEQLDQGGIALAEARKSSVDAANETRLAVVRAEIAEAACAKAQAQANDQAHAAARREKAAAEASAEILANERDKHESSMSKLRAKHTEIVQEFEAKIQDMEKHTADEGLKLRETLVQQQTEAKAHCESLKTLIATQKQKLVATVQALDEAKRENESNCAEHAANVHQMKARQKQLEEEIESERAAARLKCSALRSDIDSTRSEAVLIQTNLEADLSKLRSDYNSQVQVAQDKSEQLKQCKSEIQRVRQVHAKEIDNLQHMLAERDALRNDAENQRDEFRRKYEAALADAQQKDERAQMLVTKLATTEERAAQDITMATSKYAHETEALQQRLNALLKSSESNLESLRAEHVQQQKKSLDHERQKAAANILAVREESAAKLNQQSVAYAQLQQEHKTLLENLRKQKKEHFETRKSAASMVQRKEDEIALTRSRKATELKLKEQEISELRNQMGALKDRLTDSERRATTAEAALEQKANTGAECALEHAGGRSLFELAAREAAANGTRQQVARARAESRAEIERLRAELTQARAEAINAQAASTVAESARSNAGNNSNNVDQFKQKDREYLVAMLEQARHEANMGRKAQNELDLLRTRLQRAEERAAESAMTQCAELEQALLRTSSVRQQLRDDDEEHEENNGGGVSLGISMSPVEASDSKPFRGHSQANDISLSPSRHGLSSSTTLPTPVAQNRACSTNATDGQNVSGASTDASHQYCLTEQSHSLTDVDPEASESGILLEHHPQDTALLRQPLAELSDSVASDIVVLRREERKSGRTHAAQVPASVLPLALPDFVDRNRSEIQVSVPVRCASRPSSKRDSQVAACIAAAVVVGAAAVAASSSASSSRSTAADS